MGSGSGQTRQLAVTLTNVSSAAAVYAVGIKDATGNGVTYSVSPATASVPLAPGASATVKVTMAASQGAARGGNQAFLTVSAGDVEVAHAAVYTLVK